MRRLYKKLSLFLVLTFLINFSLVIGFVASGGLWTGTSALVIGVFYMFVPMCVAIFLQTVVYKQPLKKPFGISFRLNRWFVVALLLPVVLALLTFAVGLLFPGVHFSLGMEGMYDRFALQLTSEQVQLMKTQAASLPIHPFWLVLIQSIVAGLTINAVAGFGEELGWRGFVYDELKDLGFWKLSFITGFIWGLWHSPLILLGHNYPQHPYFGLIMMTIWCLLLAPLFTLIRERSGSVIAAAIFHGTLNGSYALAIMLLSGGNDLTIGLTGAAGFVVLGGALILIRFFKLDRAITQQEAAQPPLLPAEQPPQ
ncbi:MAG: CPBP family intramembrane glutamic endopeptidase [bacterium]